MPRFLSRFFAVALFFTISGETAFFVTAQSRRQPPPPTEGKKNKRPDPNSPDKLDDRSTEDKEAVVDTEVLTIKTNIVNVDTVVYNKKSGQIVTNLTQDNFAIFEDGVKQNISNFATPEAPITVALIIEYSKLSQLFGSAASNGFEPGTFEAVRPAAIFLQQFIKPPDDYASVIAFDMRPTPITDFTNDPKRINDSINLLLRNSPAFSENNVFDALKFTLVGGKGDSVVLDNSTERTSQYGGMVDVKSKRRAVILITSGIDTFSKINFDQTRKIVQSAGVPIYVIGTGNYFFKRYEQFLPATDSLDGRTPGRLTFLQATNTLNTFAKDSGGQHFPVTFESQVPDALRSINALLRNQYSMAYDASEGKTDGKRRKLVVKVDINKDGKYEEKEYVVQHRQFYLPGNPKEINDKKKK